LSVTLAKALPGGVKILQRFNDKDATKAFHAAQHSAAAYEMLKDFATEEDLPVRMKAVKASTITISSPTKKVPRFSPEKTPLVFTSIWEFSVYYISLFRFGQMFFGDISAGLGTRLGKGPNWVALACLAPHALLSLSSLIFRTVPKERVVGQPMIWK
jgi:hypothetical protein